MRYEVQSHANEMYPHRVVRLSSNPEVICVAHFLHELDAQAFADQKNAEVPRYEAIRDRIVLRSAGMLSLAGEYSNHPLRDKLQSIADFLNEHHPPEVE